MVTITRGAPSQAVLQGAQHVLFVEGTSDGLDVSVLGELLSPKLRVEPLGASYSVRSVAMALHPTYPYYWFVIDRDDWDDTTVEASWQTFPDPNENNLLIWRRKELESYFLDPVWLCTSRYILSGTRSSDIEQWLENEADKMLWLEAANRVLVSRRNLIKRRDGSLFSFGDLQGLTRDQVADRLVAWPLLAGLAAVVRVELAAQAVRIAFDADVATLSDGVIPLAFNRGRWIQLISAKSLFRSMINRWFLVPDQSKPGHAKLSGRDAERAVAVDLLKNQQGGMPRDFVDLKRTLDGLV